MPGKLLCVLAPVDPDIGMVVRARASAARQDGGPATPQRLQRHRRGTGAGLGAQSLPRHAQCVCGDR